MLRAPCSSRPRNFTMPPIKPSDGPVLITGASGYIGSWAVYAFVRRGYTVQ